MQCSPPFMLRSLFRNLLLGFFVHPWTKQSIQAGVFLKIGWAGLLSLPSPAVPTFWFLLSVGGWLIEIQTQHVKRSRKEAGATESPLQEKLQMFSYKHFINWPGHHSGNVGVLPVTSEKYPNAGPAFSFSVTIPAPPSDHLNPSRAVKVNQVEAATGCPNPPNSILVTFLGSKTASWFWFISSIWFHLHYI